MGYARVNTEDLHLEMQLAQLQAEGMDRIYQEKVSGLQQDRPDLLAMLDYVGEGDTVICCKLDRRPDHPAPVGDRRGHGKEGGRFPGLEFQPGHRNSDRETHIGPSKT
jgi:hypothetical protein